MLHFYTQRQYSLQNKKTVKRKNPFLETPGLVLSYLEDLKELVPTDVE
jgi:hypothetical protein